MELINQLKELQKNNQLNAAEINKVTDVEGLFFIINEAILTEAKNYNNLYLVFEEIRNLAEKEKGLNIFSENLIIKFYYFMNLYGVDRIIFDSLVELLGPVYLDFELENRFMDDDFSKYYFKRYREFKQDSELSLYRILNAMDVKGLKVEGDELKQQYEEMRKLLNIEGLDEVINNIK